MARPHVAAVIEDAVFRRVEHVLRRRGWHNRAIGHTGYGTPSATSQEPRENSEWVRVLGRVLLARPQDRTDKPAGDHAAASEEELEEAENLQRGWRAFLTAPAIDVPVTVRVGRRVVHTRTDRQGYVDVTVSRHGLPEGWHDVTIEADNAPRSRGQVQVIGSQVRRGLVSDIDDTVMVTRLPRPLIAAYNTFVRRAGSRRVVPGMAELYRELLSEHPGAPVFYLSTGAWNSAPTLVRFLRRHDYPAGPLLLTDWGPTNTGWFRSGVQHKREALHRLAREFPHVRWVLVGDDGQHDPTTYGDFASERPDRVAAIAIRQLTPQEQVLSHGLPVPNEELAAAGPWHRHDTRELGAAVPVVRAPDGHGLLRLLAWHGIARPAPLGDGAGPAPGAPAGWRQARDVPSRG
ncbi:MAG TPA: phosphatase domain-containing protein [Segeticoccus sp.]|uniref:App1 family protein n=1 Tax=Segeticoccus sp. TaxID=2706531 RepID=UPI002D807F64|nr:phosphatase domain-containing protein [Segeticoccus sp.]HET8599490.1 phosphatase domain-containing protein [Segeticoccus sp.]